MFKILVADGGATITATRLSWRSFGDIVPRLQPIPVLLKVTSNVFAPIRIRSNRPHPDPVPALQQAAASTINKNTSRADCVHYGATFTRIFCEPLVVMSCYQKNKILWIREPSISFLTNLKNAQTLGSCLCFKLWTPFPLRILSHRA